MEYRVDIVNKFALFSNDDEDSVEDPIESLLKAAQASSAKSKADKENAKISSKNERNVPKQTTGKSEKNVTRSGNNAVINQTKTVISNQEQKTRPPRPGPNNRPPRFNSKRPNENENSQESNYNEPPTEAKEMTERSFRGEDGRGRGGGFRRGGGGRGGGQGRGGNDDATTAAAAPDGFGRKREFDRHSGSSKTGLKSTDKKEGAGSHNWGSVHDEVDEQMKQSVDGQDKENEPRSDEANGDDKPDDTTNGAVEPKEMTLDEYKALQEQARSKVAFNIRKPGEGCADPKWKKMYVLKKKDEDEDEEEGDNDENEEEERPKPKNIVPIAIRFNDAPPRRGGGRGGPRGGGSRGGPGAAGGGGVGGGDGGASARGSDARLNQKAEVPAPNVADERDFPSLS